MTRSLAFSLVVALMSAMLMGAPAYAQDEVEVTPLEDAAYGIRSVVPDGWSKVAPGVYGRASSPGDPTIVGLQSAPLSRDQLWPALMPQFGLDAVPESVGERTTESFDWTLYRFGAPPAAGDVTIDLALTEDDGTTYLVLLQSSSDESEDLHASVFLPAIDAYQLLPPVITTAPQEASYRAEEVSFPGAASDITLVGTLTVPDSPGPHPVVVLLSGSGPSDRDESLPVSELKPFALIADSLTSAGVAVLRYDDRGVGASSGDFASSTIPDFTADAEAAIDFVASLEAIDPGRIGLLGHSEGGIYAADIAARDPRVSFVVGMAPLVVSGVDFLIQDNAVEARAAGSDEVEVDRVRRVVAEVSAMILDGDIEGAQTLSREHYGLVWDDRPPEVQATLGDRQSYIDARVQREMFIYSDYWRSLLEADPAPDWEQISIPVLALFGGKDVQVRVEPNEPALREVFERTANDAGEIAVIPGANHLFQAAETGEVAEYGELPPEFTPEFLPTLVGWVLEQAGVAR